jgi:Zn-dependent peptidase ImmA (M78 family)
LLQNPYAHFEQLEEQQLLRLHENPYRYAPENTDGVGRHAAHSVFDIEQIVIRLQRDIWAKRLELGLTIDADPVDALQPEHAARLLGYQYLRQPSLGWIAQGRDQIVVAGLFDPADRTIRVGMDIEPRVARFTGAHEIAHAVLHPHLAGLHRDRPLTGAVESRDRVEYEADKFASFFLMPAKLLSEQFHARFIEPFNLNDETAYALLGTSYSTAIRSLSTRRHLSRALAGASQYNGRHFVSLADYFLVSNEALAIRLEELDLVARD